MHAKKKEGDRQKRPLKKMILWTLFTIAIVALVGAGYYGATVDLTTDNTAKQTDYLNPKNEPIVGTTPTQN